MNVPKKGIEMVTTRHCRKSKKEKDFKRKRRYLSFRDEATALNVRM